MFGTQGLWAGRDLYRVTPVVTQDLGFSGLIRRTAPFSRLLRHTRRCGGSILTLILTGVEEVTKLKEENEKLSQENKELHKGIRNQDQALTSSQAKCPILAYSNLPLVRIHCNWYATYRTVWFTVLYRPNTYHIWSNCEKFTEKKFCPSRGLNRRPSDYEINCLIECATATLYNYGVYRTKNI
jgi:hypothetical protein